MGLAAASTSTDPPPVYRPRQVRNTPLYQLLESYYDDVKAMCEERFEKRYGRRRGFQYVQRAAGITLDKQTRMVSVGGQPVSLTPTEFALLAELMSAPGRVYTRSELLEALQGVSFDTMERAVNVHISNLRAKIEPDPKTPHFIETVFGVGYRFCIDPPRHED